MKKDNIKLSIFWVFSFLVIILMMFFTSHAETYDNTLPFKYSGVDNFNSFLTDDLLDCIDDASLPVYDENYVLILRDIGFVSANPVGYRFYFDLLPISTFTNYVDDFYTSSVSFSIDTNKTKYRFYVGVLYTWNGSDLVPYQYGVNGKSTSFTATSSLFGRSPITYTTGDTGKKPNWNVSYYYPCYFSKDFYFNNQKVLSHGTGSPVDVGVAIVPPSPITPEYLNGLIPPSSVPPSYIINNYSWTTQPTFDNSSTISAIESIKDFLVWLANNISGEFQNLISNLQGFFTYIGETIQYYGNMIIETLNNLIQNFYDNMKSLVENISNQIEYIKQPLDQDIIWDNISSTSLVTNISIINTSLTSFQGAFTGVNEPSSYTIPIHLENLPSNWFGNQTTQYIDLGVINGTVKDSLRLFVWAMVTYGLVVTIFDSIANYINGGGDES